MIFSILVVFISIVGLMIIHEFGHFIIAKICKVEVKELGIGYPPRIWGKKIGKTLYSLNLLPFGAFVRLLGEEQKVKSSASFSEKPIWQRALIVLGGIFSFWIVSSILFSIVFTIGIPTIISDKQTPKNAASLPEVMVVKINKNSPADLSGLKLKDRIIAIGLKEKAKKIKVNRVSQIQEFAKTHQGKEIVLTIKRKNETFDILLVPRISPPSGEGPIGVALVRVINSSYPWYISILKGVNATFYTTLMIIKGFGQIFFNIFKGLPSGVQVIGPVGIGQLIYQYFELGFNYFLQFIGLIAVYLAIFNLLPIPAVDGGRLLFLGIEKIRGYPIKKEVEQKINSAFFLLLLFLMILVTIKDIARLF